MEFGVPNFDGFVFPENNEAPSQFSSMGADPNVGLDQLRIGNDQQERFSGSIDFYVPRTTLMPLHQSYPSNPLLRSNLVYGDSSHQQQQQMFNFSPSLRPELVITPFLNKDDGLLQRLSSQAFTAFPHYQPQLPYSRNIGYGGESLSGNMQVALSSGGRGQFTPSQLMELEHQTVIFKFIAANKLVPPHLLLPLKKSLYPRGLPGSSSGFHPPNPTLCYPVGWRGPRQGYAGSSSSGDPEPTRCRRTDGKKWRCSRDAVADQKYCERHINRGRKRSGKNAEAQIAGHAAAAGTINATTAPVISKSWEPATANSSTLNLKREDPVLAAVKAVIPTEQPCESEFGNVLSDALINPAQGSSCLNFNEQELQDKNQHRQFIDEWPNDQSSHSVDINWPEELLSSSDFCLSSSSSPSQDNPLRLSREIEYDPLQMGLGVTNELGDLSQKQSSSWMANLWQGNDQGISSKRFFSWDGSPLQMGSSSADILPKGTSASSSNSSSATVQKAEDKK